MSGNDKYIPKFEYTAPSGRFSENQIAFVRVRLMSQKGGELYAQQIGSNGIDVAGNILVCNAESIVTVEEARKIARGK